MSEEYEFDIVLQCVSEDHLEKIYGLLCSDRDLKLHIVKVEKVTPGNVPGEEILEPILDEPAIRLI